MDVNIKNMFSISEVSPLVDNDGSAVNAENNATRYDIIDNSQYEGGSCLPDEEALTMAKHIIHRDRKMFEELAK